MALRCRQIKPLQSGPNGDWQHWDFWNNCLALVWIISIEISTSCRDVCRNGLQGDDSFLELRPIINAFHYLTFQYFDFHALSHPRR
jgi:hypothetical protein